MQIVAVQSKTETTTDSCQLNQTQLCSSALFHLQLTQTLLRLWQVLSDVLHTHTHKSLETWLAEWSNGVVGKGEGPVSLSGPGRFFLQHLIM